MKNFKTKDLMITINPKISDENELYNCEHHSKPDTTGCTTCTHQTTGDGTNCTSCTHQTSTTCIPHSKPAQEREMSDLIKAIELNKLKKAVSQLQKEYA